MMVMAALQSTQGDSSANNIEIEISVAGESKARVQQSGMSEEHPPTEGGTAKPGAWKWAIRQRIWDLLEQTDVAQHPRPVHHRIPNFVGNDKAADRLAAHPMFQAARTVKVDPDCPLKPFRFHVLTVGKLLVTPQPRLRTGFCSTIQLEDLPGRGTVIDEVDEASWPTGVEKYGHPLPLDAPLKIDLLVIGSVVVAPSGARLGKGEGFADIEHGVLRWMKSIDDSTPVVTVVHDCQIVPNEDLPLDRFMEFDVPVDYIITPTQVIATHTTMPKPQRIYWDKLSPQKMAEIPMLGRLKAHIEETTGQTFPTGPDEILPPLAHRK